MRTAVGRRKAGIASAESADLRRLPASVDVGLCEIEAQRPIRKKQAQHCYVEDTASRRVWELPVAQREPRYKALTVTPLFNFRRWTPASTAASMSATTSLEGVKVAIVRVPRCTHGAAAKSGQSAPAFRTVHTR